MLKTLTGIATAAVLAVGAITVAPQKAEARCVGCWVGAGVVGGLALGAVLAQPRYYGGGPYYGYSPAYYGGPRCWWQRQRIAGPNGWYVRSVRVCR